VGWTVTIDDIRNTQREQALRLGSGANAVPDHLLEKGFMQQHGESSSISS